MGKQVLVGVNNVARRVKVMHIGVNNVARNSYIGYIGVNNVAREFCCGVRYAKYSIKSGYKENIISTSSRDLLFQIDTWTSESARLWYYSDYTVTDGVLNTGTERVIVFYYNRIDGNLSYLNDSWLKYGGYVYHVTNYVRYTTSTSGTRVTYNLTLTVNVQKEITNGDIKGDFIGYVYAPEGTYPINGIQNGYWYVKE